MQAPCGSLCGSHSSQCTLLSLPQKVELSGACNTRVRNLVKPDHPDYMTAGHIL